VKHSGCWLHCGYTHTFKHIKSKKKAEKTVKHSECWLNCGYTHTFKHIYIKSKQSGKDSEALWVLVTLRLHIYVHTIDERKRKSLNHFLACRLRVRIRLNPPHTIFLYVRKHGKNLINGARTAPLANKFVQRKIMLAVHSSTTTAAISLRATV